MRAHALLPLIVLFAISGSAASARPLKGDGPTSMAVGFGSVWIGMGNGDVVRLDAESRRVQARLHGSSTGFVHDLVAADGALWVVRDGLVRVDPRTNRVRDVRGTRSGTASTIRAGAGALWLVDDGANKILRVDPKRSRLVARIRIPGRAWGVAAARAAIIAVSIPEEGPATGPSGPRLLRRIDTKTDRLSAPIMRLRCDAGITVGDAAVWTLDACTGILARRDPHTLHVLRDRKLPVVWQTPAVAFGSLWLASRGGALRVDPMTLRTIARIPARSLAISIGAGFVWAFDPAHARVRRIDPHTNRVVGAAMVVR